MTSSRGPMDVPSAFTSPAASSTWMAIRRCDTRVPGTPRPTSTAAPARRAPCLHLAPRRDGGPRQPRVLLSLRQQMDPQALIPKLPDLVAALKSTVRTDIPVSQLDELLRLASQVDTANIRSYVFAPPLYSYDTCADARGCIVVPNIARIKQAVKNAFSADPRDEALRQSLAGEGRQRWA